MDIVIPNTLKQQLAEMESDEERITFLKERKELLQKFLNVQTYDENRIQKLSNLIDLLDVLIFYYDGLLFKCIELMSDLNI